MLFESKKSTGKGVTVRNNRGYAEESPLKKNVGGGGDALDMIRKTGWQTYVPGALGKGWGRRKAAGERVE